MSTGLIHVPKQREPWPAYSRFNELRRTVLNGATRKTQSVTTPWLWIKWRRSAHSSGRAVANDGALGNHVSLPGLEPRGGGRDQPAVKPETLSSPPSCASSARSASCWVIATKLADIINDSSELPSASTIIYRPFAYPGGAWRRTLARRRLLAFDHLGEDWDFS